ncbi:MAG: hypothetical protein AAFQ59_03955 [Pseudomonadota bacterium]
MLKRLIFIALVCAALPTLAAAQTILFPRDRDFDRFVIPVYPLSATSFEVVRDDRASPAAMWCAASKYVDRYVPGDVRDLFVAQALSQSANAPGKKGMVFTIAPIANASSSVTFGVNTPGLRKSMAAANSVCGGDFFVVLRVRTAS